MFRTAPIAGLQAVPPQERIQPIVPYASYPDREETGAYLPFGGEASWFRPARAAAETAARWAQAGRRAESAVRALQDYRKSAWQERIVHTEGSLAGTAARGATLRVYAVEVDSVARAQRNEGYALSAAAASVAEPGEHPFVLKAGGSSVRLAIRVNPGDGNSRTLARLREALNGAELGVIAAIRRDSAAGTAMLTAASEMTGAGGAFSLEDIGEGSLIAATGAANVAQAAADAVYRLDGHPAAPAASNTVTLDAGKVELALRGPTGTPTAVRVGVNTAAVVSQTQAAVDALNELAAIARTGAADLHPALIRRLEDAAAAGGMLKLGLSPRPEGGWSLDGEALSAAIAADPAAAQRRVAGPQGWAGELGRTLEHFGSLPLEAMISPASRAMTAYTAYSANASVYWQLGRSGWFLNARS